MRRRATSVLLALLCAMMAVAQGSPSRYEYWIDAGQRVAAPLSGNEVSLQVDLGSLTPASTFLTSAPKTLTEPGAA